MLTPLPDAANWRRVRFWFVPALAGFRYGDRHHGVAALFVRPMPSQPAPGGAHDLCLDDFERWGAEVAGRYEVEIGEASGASIQWRGRPVTVRRRDGALRWLLARRRYAGVYASFAAWPDRCMTLAFAFRADEAPDEAAQARDRFAREAFGRLVGGASAPALP